MDVGALSLIILFGLIGLITIGVPLGFASGFLGAVIVMLKIGPSGLGILLARMYALVKGGIPDASRAFLKWERFGTAWDPPIPAVLKPLILISMILITLQAINNLIVDWNKPKEKAYDPAKDL